MLSLDAATEIDHGRCGIRSRALVRLVGKGLGGVKGSSWHDSHKSGANSLKENTIEQNDTALSRNRPELLLTEDVIVRLGDVDNDIFITTIRLERMSFFRNYSLISVLFDDVPEFFVIGDRQKVEKVIH